MSSSSIFSWDNDEVGENSSDNGQAVNKAAVGADDFDLPTLDQAEVKVCSILDPGCEACQ